MKKLFTFIVTSMLSLAASAQTISLTAEVDGASREFSFAVLFMFSFKDIFFAVKSTGLTTGIPLGTSSPG